MPKQIREADVQPIEPGAVLWIKAENPEKVHRALCRAASRIEDNLIFLVTGMRDKVLALSDEDLRKLGLQRVG